MATVPVGVAVTPDNRSLVFDQRISVDNVLSVTVTLPVAETAEVFVEGRIYYLIAKLLGDLTADPVGRWLLTRTTSHVATATCDLRLAVLRTAIGSEDFVKLQWGVFDQADGPLAAQAAIDGTPLWNNIARDGDTAPAYASDNKYTDAEVDAKLLGALPDHAPGHLTEGADPIDKATASADGLMPKEHLSAHPPPTTRDTRSEAKDVASGLMTSHTEAHPAPTTRDARNYPTQAPGSYVTVPAGSYAPDCSGVGTINAGLSGNMTEFALPTGMVAERDVLIRIDLNGYTMPAAPVSTYYQVVGGTWGAAGPVAEVLLKFDGTRYYISCASFQTGA